MKCPTSTNLKPASERSLDNFWSSDNLSNRCSYSCKRFHCRSSLACISARASCVRISCLSSRPDAERFLQELSDQLVILQSYPLPLRRYWADRRRLPLGEAIQHFWVLPLKCIDFFPLSLLLKSPLSKALVPRNIGWSVSAKFISIFSAVPFQDPSGLQS